MLASQRPSAGTPVADSSKASARFSSMANDTHPGPDATDATDCESAVQSELAALRAELAALQGELEREREYTATLRQQYDALLARQTELSGDVATGAEQDYVLDRWHRRLGAGPRVHLHEDFDDPLPEFEGY
jgi:hypothetical protein